MKLFIAVSLFLLIALGTTHAIATDRCRSQRIMCKNKCKNGVCSQVTILKCDMKCKCTPGYTGVNCDTLVTTPTTTSTAASNDVITSNGSTTSNGSDTTKTATESTPGVGALYTECIYNNMSSGRCYHGKCEGGDQQTCTCDFGWAGFTCNLECPSKCLDNCLYLDDTTYCPEPPPTPEKNYTVCARQNKKCYHGKCDAIGWVCWCDYGWGDRSCNQPCPQDCCNGKCARLKGVIQCSHTCPWINKTHKYDGCDCVTIVRTVNETVRNITRVEKAEYWLPVGVSLGTVVVFVVVVVAILAYMWKIRAIFVLKLVYRFKGYVDKDEKEFHAFVSYKSSSADLSRSSDEELFVVHHLLPKLEREFGFRICVHFRDFLPGMSIADNVVHAIQNSHRTIMLISHAYVSESVWARFEYEQAQVAVIEQKQRIIPVMYDNIDDLDINDPTLKLILDSTTYLQKPADLTNEKAASEFWTRLQLSMPKIRAVADDIAVELNTDDVISSNTVTSAVCANELNEKIEQNGGGGVLHENGEVRYRSSGNEIELRKSNNNKNSNTVTGNPDKYIKYLDI